MVDSELPHALQFVYFNIVLAIASIFVSKFIASKFPRAARVLERVCAFFVLTGFFIAITIPFSLPLKIFSSVLYAICLLVVILCN